MAKSGSDGELKLESVGTQTPIPTAWGCVKRAFSSKTALFIYILLFSLAVRLKGLCRNAFVLWDEHHFGRFMSHYLRRLYFFDVHPPIGRLLVALGGYLIGLDPNFAYDSGSSYPKGYRYCALRGYHTLFSSFSAPAAFVICNQLGLPTALAFLAAILIAFENGIAFFGRIILLDSFLLTFVSLALATMLYTFNLSRTRILSTKWVLHAMLSGLMLGFSSGIKYSGAFGAVYICALCIESIWSVYSDKKRPLLDTVKVTMIYAFSLIAIPALLLSSSFYIHLSIFDKYDKSASGVLPDYMSNLGAEFAKSSGDVVYGGLMTFLSANGNTANLHSHRNKYPGTDYYQVTAYSFIDSNNHIELRPPEYAFYDRNSYLKTDLPSKKAPVRNGDRVVLRHTMTNGLFGVEGAQSPTTKSEYRIESKNESAYARDAFGHVSLDDIAHNIWIVKDTSQSAKSTQPLKLLDSKIMFKHVLTGCVIRLSGKTLPHYIITQNEVTCRPEYMKGGNGIEWYAVSQEGLGDQNNGAEKPLPRKVNYISNIATLVKSTFVVNNSLVTPSECDSSIDTSPLSWPFCTSNNVTVVGVNADTMTGGHVGIYNPILLLTSTSGIIITTLAYLIMSAKRKFCITSNKPTPPAVSRFLSTSQKSLFVYYINYIPYTFMKRQTVVHHYLVPLYFAIVNCVVLLYFASLAVPTKFRTPLYCLVIVPLCIYSTKYWRMYMWG